jgi:3-phosphoinositide dependent protein kinase-1
LTFKKILEVDYKFPDEPDQNEDANDLIKKLLQKNPYERLGAGRYGSSNDYIALKCHPFFNGVDFDKVFLQIPPIN